MVEKDGLVYERGYGGERWVGQCEGLWWRKVGQSIRGVMVEIGGSVNESGHGGERWVSL